MDVPDDVPVPPLPGFQQSPFGPFDFQAWPGRIDSFRPVPTNPTPGPFAFGGPLFPALLFQGPQRIRPVGRPSTTPAEAGGAAPAPGTAPAIAGNQFNMMLQAITDALSAPQQQQAGSLSGIFQQLLGVNVTQNELFTSPFENLLNNLFESAHWSGPPPTSKSVLESMPKRMTTEADADQECAVCKEVFQQEEVVELPCKHIFHKDCVFHWLEMRNSCPVCRYEFPTDDADYEREKERRKQREAAREQQQQQPPPSTAGSQPPSGEAVVSPPPEGMYS